MPSPMVTRSPTATPSNYGYARQHQCVAAQQCSAAVQNRLYNRTSIGGILGAVLGANTTGPRAFA